MAVWRIIIIHCFFSVIWGQMADYKYYKALDPAGYYVLGWKYNDTDIDLELTVQTTGYVGFGISKDGKMFPADMVIGWINNGQMYLGDYYTTNSSRTPYMDLKQDWIVKEGLEQNGTTVLRFSRKLDTCDGNDEPFTRGRMTVIYCYHNEDPDVISGLVPFHGTETRGAKEILIFENDVAPQNFPPPETFMVEFNNYMYTIPPTGSVLQCVVFDMKSVLPRSHLIKYEPIITPGNEAFVYRMILYRCKINDTELNGRVFECENEAPTTVKSCKTMIASWDLGAEAFHFPSDVGIPFGGTEDPNYVLEIHYSKYEESMGPDGAPATIPDSSGLRVTYTTSPISNKAALLELGSLISSGSKQIIPPGEKDFRTTSYCSPRCLNWGFANNSTPITAIAVVLKGNDIAKDIKIRHFRGKNELPWIMADGSFSNFFQAPRLLASPITIESSDTIAVECTYNSSAREVVTTGGWARIEEVCMAALIYYPAKEFDKCLSWSSLDKLTNTKGEQIPENEAISYLTNITLWDLPTKKILQEALEQSSERSICSSSVRHPAYAIDRYTKPIIAKEYTQVSSCPK